MNLAWSSREALDLFWKNLYNTPIEAGPRWEREASVGLLDDLVIKRPKLKLIRSEGPPKVAAIWYRTKFDAQTVFDDAVRNGTSWVYKHLDDYRTGFSRFESEDFENDDEEVWYGVALDLDPEVNEFGVVSP